LAQWNSAGEDFSLYQPGFDDQGNLLVVSDQPQDSESDGFWKLVRCADCETKPLDQNRYREFETDLYLPKPGEEMGVAQWQLGTRTWAIGGAKLLGSGLIDGQAWLGWLESGKSVQAIESSDSLAARFHSLCWNEKTGSFYALMESADRPCQVIEAGANSIIPLATLSVGLPKTLVNPESIQIRTATGNLYGHFYPAVNSVNEQAAFGDDCAQNVEPDTEKMGGVKAAPLVIQLHGGPTAYADASLDMQKQYWSANGFHLLVLNYRGSSGFGRTYRHALKNNWGITDVEDVFSACQYLVQQRWAEPGAIFIRGNSAGGYTVLAALSDSNAREFGIAGGASLYGISDLELLNQHTHKFESEYLSWLIGDPEVHRQRYRERSAIHRLNDFELPVIFFQGANDRVVPPDQTQRIHDALKEKGVATEYCLFAGEGHGFRKAVNRQTVLERELAFYLCQLKIGS
ncbi:MAG: alpha/beta hydrolase family protein, partial [Oceanobacter sp.]